MFTTVVFYINCGSSLKNVLKEKAKVKLWSSAYQQAFDKVKCGLFSPPVLAAPCMDRPLKQRVGETDVGVGALLFQTDSSGVDSPMSF